MSEPTWLPNLVGGVSIWKLAVDLNEAKFFDGRLLVPETEGSESLPVTVRWDLSGLVPLPEARAKWPDETSAAVADFKAALDRVAKVFATPDSGFDKYKEAFTVPSLEAEGGANYYYSPEQKKLFVINWGASPRSMGGKAEYVFGYEDWGRGFAGKEAALAGAAAAALGAAAAGPSSVRGPGPDKPEADKKEKKDGKARPWWLWPLFGLVAIALVLLALLLLHSCEDKPAVTGPDAADEAAAALDAAGEAEDAAGGEDAGADDASAEAAAEAGADAMADGGNAGADAAADAAGADGGDAGGDGGLAMEDDDDDDDPGGGGGASGGAGGGKVVVVIGPAGGAVGPKTGPHRRHYHGEAVRWRVVSGNDKVARTEQRGRRYDVWLGAGRTFEGVRVEWQDAAGRWHPH